MTTTLYCDFPDSGARLSNHCLYGPSEKPFVIYLNEKCWPISLLSLRWIHFMPQSSCLWAEHGMPSQTPPWASWSAGAPGPDLEKCCPGMCPATLLMDSWLNWNEQNMFIYNHLNAFLFKLMYGYKFPMWGYASCTRAGSILKVISLAHPEILLSMTLF